MAKRLILKIVAAIVVIVFMLASGFFIGINYDFIRRYILNPDSARIIEPEVKTSGLARIDTSIEDLDEATVLEALELVFKNSINIESKDRLIESAINGMLESLEDRHADYFSRNEYSQIMESYSGTMSGIGIIVSVNEEEEVVIIQTIEDTPAYREGLKQDDIITAVDGTPIKGLSLDKVVSMIKGEEGTDVTLTIRRPSEERVFSVDVTRQRFYVPNFFIELIEDNIAYIQYIDFQDDGFIKLRDELEELVMEEQIEGIIFDLRNNLGGVLDDAVGVSDLFLDSGVIVTVEGRSNGKDIIEEYKAEPGGLTELPLIVLINDYSASASELVAGAIKYNGRAKLVGETSFGKGTVQVLYELSDGSGIKFTNAKYYLPNGESIDATGIEPDIEVTLTPEDTEDLQLESAVEEIKKLID